MDLYTGSTPNLHKFFPEFLEVWERGDTFIHRAAEALGWEQAWPSSWERLREAAEFGLTQTRDVQKVPLYRKLIRLCSRMAAEEQPWLGAYFSSTHN